MSDIFDHKILCKRCGKEMKRVDLIKSGFKMRAIICPDGHDRIVHPEDINEYNKFKELKGKEFRVKMRVVGNSYAVSIPKEIVSFMQEQEKLMNDIVKLCFEDRGKLSLTFDKLLEEENDREN